MLRVVNFRKAALAGAGGALAWEAATRTFGQIGVPVFDVVKTLGTLAFPPDQPLGWWTIGLAAHVAIGVCWAVFYAYFFWARLSWPPPLQGLAFAAIPTLLATGLMHRQFGLMHLNTETAHLSWRSALPQASLAEVIGLVLGHAIWGLTMGAIYHRPVGYSADHESRRIAPTRRSRSSRGERRGPDGHGFIFATGIECSYPTVENGAWRCDQMASTRHYDCWQDDFERAREIGVSHLRYGPPLHLILRGPGEYDWSLIDEPMRDLRERGPVPIVDLCHFGLPKWLGDFQNPELADALASYAEAFAARYSWVRFYTPVNEMYVCARLSALEGVWNEQKSDEKAFVTAVFNLAEASGRMSDALLSVRPDAVFVNSESSEFHQPCCPDPRIQGIASFENERRFLPLDLIYAHPVSDRMLAYLREHGCEDRYRRFLGREVPRRSILGLDYYEWNERLIDHDGRPRALGELFGWYVIASQYHERYQRPLMHTETNRLNAAEGPRWLWRQWHNVQLLKRSGAPIVGFTWYSLVDQTDWNIALREPLGLVDPVGLFDLNRDPREVGLAYKHLIDLHRDDPEYQDCRPLIQLMD